MTSHDELAAAIGARWQAVRDRIEQAAVGAGRDPQDVRLVAVTKGFGLDVVRAARRAGLDRFGENRVQEAEAKVAAEPDAEWHLVGHLQANKARRAVASFAWIHSVDSAELLERVDRLAAEGGRQPTVLLQVNVTSAATQHGFDPSALRTMSRRLSGLHGARIRGLMAIGPQTGDADVSRAAFARLRGLRDELQQASGSPLPELSMGMSDDLEPAVAEGATVVRVGTALFGPRPG